MKLTKLAAPVAIGFSAAGLCLWISLRGSEGDSAGDSKIATPAITKSTAATTRFTEHLRTAGTSKTAASSEIRKEQNPASGFAGNGSMRTQDRAVSVNSVRTRPEDGTGSHHQYDRAENSSEAAGKPVQGRESATTPQAPVPAGLRLAPDVRLPVAAMPVDFPMTSVAEKALKNIVDDYYRDLGTGLAAELDAIEKGETTDHEAAGGHVVEVGESGEKTLIVTNGPVAEAARKRADYRFKALFGNVAYNRMTMKSNLESRLPVAGRN